MQRVYEANEWGKVSKRIVTEMLIKGTGNSVHDLRSRKSGVQIFKCKVK